VKNKQRRLISDVKYEIDNHLSETKNLLDCFLQNSKKPLEFSMNFDYVDIIEMNEFICT